MRENIKKVIGEFLACTFIAFFGLGLIIPLHLGYIDILALAIAFGCVFALTIMIFVPISGCHLTPGVTIASTIFGGFDKKLTLPFIGAQVAGWGVGTAPIYLIFWNQLESAIAAGVNPATWLYSSTHTGDLWLLFALETALSAFLVITIFAILDHSLPNKPSPAFIPWAIGIVIAVGVLLASGFTGPCINTARDLGPRIVAFIYGLIADVDVSGIFMNWQWVLYIIAPILGCILGGFIYHKVYKKLTTYKE